MAEKELKDLVIPGDKIILNKNDMLGRGGYGYVCHAVRELENGRWENVAAKMMVTEGHIPEKIKKSLVKEACKLKEVSQHANIVKLLGVLMEINNYGLILELMVFADSVNFINEYEVVWPQNKLPVQLCYQVSSAMAYLHHLDPPMLHMDLKGDNILINHEFDAKVCDFGISEWKTRTTRPVGCREGTLSHVAPELLLDVNIKSTRAQDVYSYGICVWELFTGKKPYTCNKNSELIKTAVKDGQRPDMADIGDRCPDLMVNVMKQCWNQKPELRPTFEELHNQLGTMCKTLKGDIFLGKKAIRRKICEKFPSVNDRERMMTEHWDSIEEPLHDGDLSFDAEPASPEAKQEIHSISQDEISKARTITDTSPPLVGKQYKFNLPKKDTLFDTKVREILRDPLLMEMVIMGYVDESSLPKGVKELLSNPTLLQKYIDEDTSFKLELQRSGHSVFETIHCAKLKDAKHKGVISQREAEDKDVFHYTKYHPTKSEDEKNDREKRQDARQRSMQASSYIGKLYKNDLFQKVMKALKEPYHIQEALNDLETGSGEAEKFSIIGHDVLEVLQDPIMMQIVLSRDPEALDSFMRHYPKLTMKLLASNKTQYGRPVSRGTAYRPRHSSDPVMQHSRFDKDPFDNDSDEEKRDILMKAGLDHLPFLPSILASGHIDPRLREMLYAGVKGKRQDNDFGGPQMAVKKEKKKEPVPKSVPNPTNVVRNNEGSPAPGLVNKGSPAPGLVNQVPASAAVKIKLPKAEVTLNSDVGDTKPREAEELKKPVHLSLEASMDEMSLADTADGIILYSEDDRVTVDGKIGVTEAITLLKNISQPRVPNLQLRLVDELPVSGLTEFNLIEYILSHFNYILIFLTPNFTPDMLTRYQSQMCLMDTVMNKSWRVIPLVRDKLTNIPLELQVLKPLQLYNLTNHDERVKDMFTENFARTILVGREKGFATKSPSLEVNRSRSSLLPSNTNPSFPSKPLPQVKPTSAKIEVPPHQQQRQAGSEDPNPPGRNSTEDDTQVGPVDKPGVKKNSKPTEKLSPDTVTPGIHTLFHKHSGGGVTRISFAPGSNIPNLQVGNKNVMIIGAGGEVKRKSEMKSKKPKGNVKITESEKPLTRDNIDDVCSEIGKDWRRLCRSLGFSDGECEQFYQDFHATGIYEVTYQAVKKWKQKNPQEAIQKKMAELLLAIDRDDLATKL